MKELEQLVDVMRQAHGRDISVYDPAFLAKSLERRLAATSLQPAAYLGVLAQNSAEAAELDRSLHITHSEFFRNPLAFALLEALILPQLCEEKNGRAEMRIWSAGCAAGQEPYSVAILLDDLAAARGKSTLYRIFATDRSETELVTARQGVYDSAVVQNVRLKHLRNHFTQQGDAYTIVTRLRQRVDFSCHDLLDQRSASPSASIYGGFDIILCSNLLFYYRPAIQQFILNQMQRALAPDGYLVTGETERAIVQRAEGFQAIAQPATVFQRTQC